MQIFWSFFKGKASFRQLIISSGMLIEKTIFSSDLHLLWGSPLWIQVLFRVYFNILKLQKNTFMHTCRYCWFWCNSPSRSARQRCSGEWCSCWCLWCHGSWLGPRSNNILTESYLICSQNYYLTVVFLWQGFHYWWRFECSLWLRGGWRLGKYSTSHRPSIRLGYRRWRQHAHSHWLRVCLWQVVNRHNTA